MEWKLVLAKEQSSLRMRIDDTCKMVMESVDSLYNPWEIYESAGSKSKQIKKSLARTLVRALKDIPKYGVIDQHSVESIVLSRMEKCRHRYANYGSEDMETHCYIIDAIRRIFRCM